MDLLGITFLYFFVLFLNSYNFLRVYSSRRAGKSSISNEENQVYCNNEESFMLILQK